MSRLLIVIFITISCAATNGYAARADIYVKYPHAFTANESQPLIERPGELKSRDIEKIAGRKLRFREKIQLIILKMRLKKIRKNVFYEADPEKQAVMSLIAGLAVVVLLVLGITNLITGVAFLALIPALALVALWLGWRSARSGKNFKNMFGIIAGGLVTLAAVLIVLGILIFGVV